MLKAQEADKIAVDVKAVPPWFCSNWPTARVALNAVVSQIGNPVVKAIWSMLRAVLNAVHKSCPR